MKLSSSKDGMVNFEYFENLELDYLLALESDLLKHPDYEKLKHNFIVDFENLTLIQIYEKIPLSEIEDLTSEEGLYYPMCSKEEIKRIFDVKTATDYLLKYRANQILQSERLGRVLRTVRLKSEHWDFTKYFELKQFSEYLSYLPTIERDLCSKLPHGTIYMQEANGYRIKSDFGDVVVISFSLYYFLYYMAYFHIGSYLNEKQEDLSAALIIAIKTMLGTEPLDFEFDTRGDLPDDINADIMQLIEDQLLFIIGHEFAHHYLNHVTTAAVNSIKLDYNSVPAPTYNFSQLQEFEADYYSIKKPEIRNIEREGLLNGAFLFFLWLDLYASVQEYIYPSTGRIKTHPEPLERLWELRKKNDKRIGMSKTELAYFIKYYANIKKELLSILPYSIDNIEGYYSTYLPSYKTIIVNDRLL